MIEWTNGLLAQALFLLQGEPTAEPAEAPPAQTGFADWLPMMLGIILIFYFVAWRPQAKERRAREAMMKSLQKGDRVLLSSGMFGTIAAVNEKEVTLKVDDKNNVRLRFTRSAVQTVLRDSEDSESKEPATAE